MSNSFFEAISRHFNDALPFVMYRKPNEFSVKGLLQEDNTLYKTSDFTESGFVMAPFNADKASVLIPIAHSEYIEATYKSVNVEISGNDISPFVNETTKLQHIDLVEKGIQAIKTSEFEKIVLSRCETIPVTETNPIEIFKLLLNTYTTAFIYCWYHPDIGLWLGATPETLLKVEGTHFETMSLAGTQPYSGTLDVSWNEKELDEQRIVTNSIVDHLDDSIDNLQVFPTRTIKAGSLLHLQTKVSGSLNFEKATLSSILQRLHPTPAVCGFPKNRAKQFILDNEQYDREFYTGFLGELNMKQTRSRNVNRRNVENNAYTSIKTISNLFVNLRCMQLQHQKVHIYVGGGITKNSQPINEFDETVNKSKTMYKVLKY